MSSKLYNDKGYVNIPWIRSLGLPLNFIWGGRATGKTFGALEDVRKNEIPFMFLRRTQAQIDLINKPEFNPYKSVCRLHTDWDVGTSPITKYNSGFYNMKLDGERSVPEGTPIGYTGAVSTFANLRGFDASDVEIVIYDEFIPERHERPLKHEAEAFLNALETIGRNRELNGGKPLQALCLANANNLANPLFIYLGLVRKATDMERKGQEVCIMRERGIGMFNLCNSPISGAKRDTTLYRITSGSEFETMAIDNKFTDERGRIRSAPLREYRPLVAIGEICVYEHKSDGDMYISGHISGSPQTFTTGSSDLQRVRKLYGYLWQQYLFNAIEFEDIECEILFKEYFTGGVK